MGSLEVRRLTVDDAAPARAMFRLFAEVFETEYSELGDDYLARILSRPDLWALAAFEDGVVVGGITAHVLMMTRSESSELFIYDLAVRPEHQRRGIGRRLVSALLDAGRAAGITVAFVPADDEDVHALDFYRAIGGAPAPVTIFTFGDD
ncbi:GNAT family N-acetyltransferase [Myxococcota bacterium]|nr:GNAT family N-acetyltransferase [Myxococcota bacterium]